MQEQDVSLCKRIKEAWLPATIAQQDGMEGRDLTTRNDTSDFVQFL
jgi:hypothetical protein